VGEGFFDASQDQLEMESQYESQRKGAEMEIKRLTKEMQEKEAEFNKLQNELNKARGTHMSGFSLQNSVGSHSQMDVESVKNQLESVNTQLDNERN
jgi:glycine cleavage system regulatory protein